MNGIKNSELTFVFKNLFQLPLLPAACSLIPLPRPPSHLTTITECRPSPTEDWFLTLWDLCVPVGMLGNVGKPAPPEGQGRRLVVLANFHSVNFPPMVDFKP